MEELELPIDKENDIHSDNQFNILYSINIEKGRLYLKKYLIIKYIYIPEQCPICKN